MARSYEYVTLDVFTRRRFEGNPLAVVFQAEGLTPEEMQRIAAEFNFSETIFLLPPEDRSHSARVRILNRTHELPFAGHPTIGAAVALARRLRDHEGVIRLEAPAGLVEARLVRDPDGVAIGAVVAAPQPLSLGGEVPVTVVAACAGLQARDIVIDNHPPMVASVGSPYVIAEVTEAALVRCAIDVAAFRTAVDARPDMNGRLSLLLYAREGRRLHARMFAPLAGTFEDPATGSANGPLGALLLSLTGEAEADYSVRQGVEMGRPSELRVRARRTADGIRADIAGDCVFVMRGRIDI